MRKESRWIVEKADLSCFLLIFLCFFLSSCVYLSWLYRLGELVSASAADFLSMVAGYLLQASGLGLFALAERKAGSLMGYPSFAAALCLLVLCCVPAARSGYVSGVLVFGLLSNLLTGFLAGFYLRALSSRVEEGHRGLVFGGGYAAAAVAGWLVSLPLGHGFLKSGYALLFYAALALLILVLFRRDFAVPKAKEPRPTALPEGSKRLLVLAAVTVALLSLVKNIGFGFPMADLAEGVSLEFSRLLYAVGLVIAGFISDKSRKYGAMCTLAALITPFILLALRGEPVPATVFWALDYLFYGFFSVFRVLYFSDLSGKLGAGYLAGFGLLFGRVGDALGSAVYSLLAGRFSLLLTAAALLFAGTVFLFFRLYQKSYLADPAKEKNEQELFEQFSARYDLSPKERSVMRLVIGEQSNAEIAQALFVSESTVKFHIHNILKKTGCKNRASLLSRYRADTVGPGEG